MLLPAEEIQNMFESVSLDIDHLVFQANMIPYQIQYHRQLNDTLQSPLVIKDEMTYCT